MNSKKRFTFSKTVIISGIIVFIFLLIGIAIFASLILFPFSNNQNVELDITIIAYSTRAPILNALNDKVISTPTSDLQNIIFTKGLKVIIQGTGGEGLRLHQQAGQNSPTIYLANEGDLYIISDGPVIIGGYVWWQINSIATEGIEGWAAQDFLQLKIMTQ